METFGQAARRLRGVRPLRDVARDAFLDPGYLSKIEHGKQQPTVEAARKLEQALGVDGDLIALLGPRPWHLDGGLWRPADSDRLADELATATPSAENATELAHLWLIAEPPQVTTLRSGRRIGETTVAEAEERVHKLRLLDDHVGGTETHAMVTAELEATGALLRDGAYSEALGKRLLIAVGELAQLAGWTLSDAGQHARAEQIYLLGVRAAHAGGDIPGAANNLSSLAYQVANVGDPREAETLARSAYAGARHAATATTRALLAERVAWAAARAGGTSAADRALGRVETEYSGRQPADDPIWTYWLSEEEIQIMAGRVWTELRRPLRAVPILERATAGYTDETGRETALYLTWLAESLLDAREPERAATEALKALRLSRRAGSVRADDRVALLSGRLREHAGVAEVDAFLDELAEEPEGDGPGSKQQRA